MANNQTCINLSCDRPALYHRRTLCQLHYRNPAAIAGSRRPAKPTKLPEWEWIKEYLGL